MYKDDNKLPTRFASAERSILEDLEKQKDYIKFNLPFFEITNAVPSGIMVLNNNRQIVFANKQILNLLELENDFDLIGQRPGEALNCEHAFETGGGCGTTEFCRTCGAVKSILSSLDFKSDVQECRIIQNKTRKALDLRVWVTPLQIKDESFTIFAIQDIQDEKRRKVLERIFFHDILNTASGLRGLSELIQESEPEELNQYKDILNSLTERLIDEIKAQRELSFAENGELGINISQFNSFDFLQELINSTNRLQVTREKALLLDKYSSKIEIESDSILLGRVVLNMIKNALEASGKNHTITVGCRVYLNNIEFWVNNPTFMKREIQLQIFQRSFSTKGIGRGLGTYSIKLLTEQYLQGKVWFTSKEDEGTTFFVSIPIKSKLPSSQIIC